MRDVLEAQPLELFATVADDVAEHAVDAHEAAVEAHQRHSDRGVVDRPVEALLRLLQDLLGTRELVLTPDWIEKYLGSIDVRNPWYTHDSPFGGPVAPAAVFNYELQLSGGWHPPGIRGAILNTGTRWEFHRPMRPGQRITVRSRVLDYVERFVALQVENVPTYLRVPYLAAVVGFQWMPVLRFGQRFLDLPLETQRAYLALWSEAPLAPMRDFVRLIRNCALLAYYDHPDVCRALGAGRADHDQPADRSEGAFE